MSDKLWDLYVVYRRFDAPSDSPTRTVSVMAARAIVFAEDAGHAVQRMNFPKDEARAVLAAVAPLDDVKRALLLLEAEVTIKGLQAQADALAAAQAAAGARDIESRGGLLDLSGRRRPS